MARGTRTLGLPLILPLLISFQHCHGKRQPPPAKEQIAIEGNLLGERKIRIALLEPCLLAMAGAATGTGGSSGSGGGRMAEPVAFSYKNIKNRVQEAVLEEIYGRIAANLAFTGLYQTVHRAGRCQAATAYVTRGGDGDISDYIFSGEFSSDFDFALTIDVVASSGGRVKLRLFLWDIAGGRLAAGKYYLLDTNGNNSNSYRLSNVISDVVFEKTTGERGGIFDSRIAYIRETGEPGNRKKQVVIMTFDGTRTVTITDSKNIKLTPVFSRHSQDEIYYLEYTEEGPFIVKHNMRRETFTRISSGHSMTSSANCNPNGKVDQLVLAGAEQDADTDLYLFDIDDNRNVKLTKGGGINTSPSFSPEGGRIVFVSNRDGQKKLYLKDLRTGRETLLSRSGGTYDKPSWSPDGRLISFVRTGNGSFYIGLMDSEGKNIRYLTKSFLVEGVKWSPNSRYLIYTKQTSPVGPGSVPGIYIMDILTKEEIRLNTPQNMGASDPDWIMNPH